MPGFFSVIATPGAYRIARGEEWPQTNTLDGQKGHDAFIRIGEPAYFQEYGPAGYHDSIGFANPAIINARHAGVCAGSDPNLTGTNCTNSVTGKITGERLSGFGQDSTAAARTITPFHSMLRQLRRSGRRGLCIHQVQR